MTKRLEIILDKDGGIKVEAFDFKGATCEEATQFLEELFGEAEEKTLKEEYHMKVMVQRGLPSGHCG